jgi:hypothetical protein
MAQFCHTTESGPNLPYNTCFSDIKKSNSTYLWNKIGEESISNFFNAYSLTKKGLTQCQNKLLFNPFRTGVISFQKLLDTKNW